LFFPGIYLKYLVGHGHATVANRSLEYPPEVSAWVVVGLCKNSDFAPIYGPKVHHNVHDNDDDDSDDDDDDDNNDDEDATLPVYYNYYKRKFKKKQAHSESASTAEAKI